jgi:hypothetical protein
MSRATNVIVSAGYEWNAMNEFLREDRERRWFGSLTRITHSEWDLAWVHDGQSPEGDIWIGTFNHFDREGFLADLAQMPWERPEVVQVFMLSEEEDVYGVWLLNTNGVFTEVPLPGYTRRPCTLDCAINDPNTQFVKQEIGLLIADK